MSIQRYEPTMYSDPIMRSDDNGEYVTYADHLAEVERIKSERLVSTIFHSPDTGAKAFVLRRTTDVSGVSGTGIVADGVEFPDGCVCLRWRGGNPTSVVFHDNGMASVEAIHGHGGNTEVVWISEDIGERAAEMDEVQRLERERIVEAVKALLRVSDGRSADPVVYLADVLAVIEEKP